MVANCGGGQYCYEYTMTSPYVGERQLRHINGSITTQYSTTTTTHTCKHYCGGAACCGYGCGSGAATCSLPVTSATVGGTTISNILTDHAQIVQWNVQEGWL